MKLAAACVIAVAGLAALHAVAQVGAAHERVGDAIEAQLPPEPTVDDRIKAAKACIADSEARIRREREVGREVGVVDRNALYLAGVNKVSCQHQLADLQKCKPTNNCPADPTIPPGRYAKRAASSP